MRKHRLLYSTLGATIAFVAIALVVVYVVPTLADEIYLPIVTSGVPNNSNVESASGEIPSNPLTVIPLLPAEPLSKVAPTATPGSISDPPKVIEPIPNDPTADPPVEADLSPDLPVEEKAFVIIQYADGKRTKILVGPDAEGALEKYLSGLPAGTMLVTSAPPASLMGHQPPDEDK